jgi:hypothetical protein
MVDTDKFVLMKLHSVQGQNILAICDPELIGKKFVWGDLEILVSKGFYEGEHVPIDVMERTAHQCTSINAIGKTCVKALLKAGLVEKEAIVYINDIPHCQVYVV